MSNEPRVEREFNTPAGPMYPIVEYGVGSWCPGPPGPNQGKPEAVVFHFKVEGLGEIQFGLRLKTRAAVNNLIQMLAEMRDVTFPT